jgi:flagellar protein FliO/FliZ
MAVAAAGPEAAGSAGQVLLGLAVVLGLIFGAAWFLRRLGGLPLAGSQTIQVLGGTSVGPRERVVLVQVGETQILLGVAPGRVQALHVLERPLAAPAVAGDGAESFAGRLSALLKSRSPR